MGYQQHKELSPNTITCGVVIVSDSRNLSSDESGKLICHMMEEKGHRISDFKLIKNDAGLIKETLFGFIGQPETQMVITSGGTGLSHRDITVETVAAAEPHDCVPVEATDPLYILYTSGTTGRPKGAMISHENILFLTESFSSVIGYDGNDELLSYLPLAHLGERVVVENQALVCGGTVYFNESQESFLNDLRNARPNWMLGVPRNCDCVSIRYLSITRCGSPIRFGNGRS